MVTAGVITSVEGLLRESGGVLELPAFFAFGASFGAFAGLLPGFASGLVLACSEWSCLPRVARVWLAAVAAAGILALEQTYTAKALAALLDLDASGRFGGQPVVFLNTFGPK
jgi:hypothetical protein